MISHRRLILALAGILTALSTNVFASECATCKGSWKAGGGLYFILRKGEQYDPGSGYSNWGASFTPNVEKFVSNGFSIGSEILFTYDHAGSKYYYTREVNYGIIPTLSGYFPLGGGERTNAGSFFLIKIGAGFVSTYIKHKGYSGYDWYYGYGSSSSTTTSTVVAGQFGIMPMLSRSVGLEVGTHIVYTSTEGRYGLVFQFGVGFSMFAL